MPGDLLTGPDAADLLEAAVSTAGGHLRTWRVTQVDHRGGETTVAYQASVQWPTGRTDDVLGATSLSADDEPPQAPGTLTLSDGEHRVCVWRLPDDPGLPGLTTAMNPARLRRLLRSFGLEPTASGLHTELIAYRPKRRAVIRISAPGTVLYAKVLPPGDVEALHRRHEMLHAAGVPVPRSLGWTEDGLLLLENLPGTPLRRRLMRPGPDLTTGLPGPEDVLTLLNRLPPGVLGLTRRRPWSRRAPQYAELVGKSLPAEAERARQLGEAIASGLKDAPQGADPTHGDFYEAQLTVDDAGRIVGLLDVDTVGPGSRLDDLACALAHCEALALSSDRHAARAHALAGLWRPAFERRADAGELRLRTAGVLMSLATGPHRVQRPDWEAATGRLLDRLEDVLAGK